MGRSDYCFEKENKIVQEIGRLELPKMKSKVRKVYDLGFCYLDPRWQMAANGCLQKLDCGHHG